MGEVRLRGLLLGGLAGAWVYAITRYKLVDLLRRRSRKELLNDPLEHRGLKTLAAKIRSES